MIFARSNFGAQCSCAMYYSVSKDVCSSDTMVDPDCDLKQMEDLFSLPWIDLLLYATETHITEF